LTFTPSSSTFFLSPRFSSHLLDAESLQYHRPVTVIRVLSPSRSTSSPARIPRLLIALFVASHRDATNFLSSDASLTAL
jgi:hypothetical protein